MKIRQATKEDRELLPDLWLRSVRATHTFLTEGEIQSLLPFVREYLTSPDAELWVLFSADGAVMGFLGMSGCKIEAMFLAPEFLRQGGGRRFVEHALSLHAELTVDVNEQNPAACRFYESCGFVVERRSGQDDAGRPYPLLHMRLQARKYQFASTKGP